MANTAAEFEKAITLLQQADPNGSTLYDHITRLLLRIAKDKPENALDNLEAISVAVKKAALSSSIFKERQDKVKPGLDKRKSLEAVEGTLNLFKKIPYLSTDGKATFLESLADYAKAMEDDDIEEDKKPSLPTLPGSYVPDIMGQARLLEWAGVGIPDEEMYRVTLSIQALARETKYESIRFFGKILGTQASYYICEAKFDMKSYPKALKSDPLTKNEPSGQGINEYIYLVASSPDSKWVQLPDVTPEQLITSRQMRRFFTGNLNAPVTGYPRFPFPEATYLRCQIARISAATVISPKGFYTMEDVEPDEGDEEAEEVQKMVEDPEFEALSTEDLQSAENWVHHRAHILKQGRSKPWAPPEGEEEEEAGEEEEEEEPEEAIPMLNGLENDALPKKAGEEEEGGDEDDPLAEKFWNIKAEGSITVARNLSWPGSCAVAQGKMFSNIYLGWGQKYTPDMYAPPPPPAVMSEYKSNFNPEEAEEGETDPLIEQVDPQPPKAEKEDGDEGDEGDEEEED